MNTDKFSNQNEELNFAKYMNINGYMPKRPVSSDNRNPITGQNCKERDHKYSRKASNSFNKLTMFDHKSKDEVFQRKGKGVNQSAEIRTDAWKPHLKFNNKAG